MDFIWNFKTTLLHVLISKCDNLKFYFTILTHLFLWLVLLIPTFTGYTFVWFLEFFSPFSEDFRL